MRSAVEQEIKRVEAKIERQDAAIDDRFPFDPTHDCCPSCLYGDAYVDECDAQDRRREWLKMLRGKLAQHPRPTERHGHRNRRGHR